jgi:LmbE family N-acetylglucosaminyl deacetylase
MIEVPTLIVAAHPDDETIGIGAQLHRLRNGLLLHLTDGAPCDGHDACAHGFATIADYAEARAIELASALSAGEAGHLRRIGFGIADQAAWLDMAALTRRVAGVLRSEAPQSVVVHPYEGGHPDHDAAAFAVHAACALIARDEAPAPAVVEMASYHAVDGRRAVGAFLPGEGEVVTVPLGSGDRRRKNRMIACFRTQRAVLAWFDGIYEERFRRAPAYDFRQPPHPGALLYETLGWGITGAEWRRYAAAALADLGLDGRPWL